MSNAALEQLVDEVRDLPLTVSDVLAQVITECDNADASVSSLARIMAGDQALAAMVLKLANSAYYGYARRIESLPDAVVLLGFASVKNLAITASITRLLATDRDDRREHPLRPLRPLAGDRRRRPHPRPHEPHLGREGLRRRPAARPRPDRPRLLRQAASAELLRAAEERGVAVRGRRARGAAASSTPSSAPLIAAEWKFPPAPLRGAALPPRPGRRRGRPALARSIHCADWVANRMGIGLVSPGAPEWPEEISRNDFQIDQHSIGALESEIRAEFLEGSSLKAA